MTDLEKPKRKSRDKKPPTQTAGVTGIDGHGGMGEAPIEPAKAHIDWRKLIALPAFEMFAFEESGNSDYASITSWIESRRASIGDSKLYDQYAVWHKDKGLWLSEKPTGELI